MDKCWFDSVVFIHVYIRSVDIWNTVICITFDFLFVFHRIIVRFLWSCHWVIHGFCGTSIYFTYYFYLLNMIITSELGIRSVRVEVCELMYKCRNAGYCQRMLGHLQFCSKWTGQRTFSCGGSVCFYDFIWQVWLNK